MAASASKARLVAPRAPATQDTDELGLRQGFARPPAPASEQRDEQLLRQGGWHGNPQQRAMKRQVPDGDPDRRVRQGHQSMPRSAAWGMARGVLGAGVGRHPSVATARLARAGHLGRLIACDTPRHIPYDAPACPLFKWACSLAPTSHLHTLWATSGHARAAPATTRSTARAEVASVASEGRRA